jgi:hypothetical protein
LYRETPECYYICDVKKGGEGGQVLASQ